MNSRVEIPNKLKPRAESLLNFRGGDQLPMILQTEMAECGLACLAMIAGRYGYDTDLTSLRRRFSISSHGINLKHLMSIAGKLHLAPRALRCEPEDLSNISLPCILHWSLNHFVVLKSVGKNKFHIHDPAFGERELGAEDFGKNFTGVAVELTPTHEFFKIDDRKKLRLSDFWKNAIGLKRSLAQVILLSLFLQVFALASPFYMQTIVDDVLLRKDDNLLTVLAIGFTLLMLIQLGTSALREFVILHFSNKLGIQMSVNLFRHLIRLPMDYFYKRHMGDIVSRFGSLANVRKMLTDGMVVAAVDGAMAMLTLVAMFIYDVKLTFIVLGIVVIYGLLRWYMYRPFRVLNEEMIIAAAKENSHFMESIRAIQTIKLFQRENDRQHLWQNRLADVMNKNIKISRWGIGYSTLNGFLFGIENILVVYFAATAVMGNIISLGMLYAFMSYKGRFINSMDSLIAQWIEFKMLDLHLNRLADIAYTDAENIDSQEIDSEYSQPAETIPKASQYSPNDEKLINTNFINSLEGWLVEHHHGAETVTSVQTDEARTHLQIDVTQPGSETWSVQLAQNKIAIVAGATYRISLWAKATDKTEINAAITLGKEPWAVLAQNSFEPSRDWQEFSYEFVSPVSMDEMRLLINGFGNKKTCLGVTKISLTESRSIAVEKIPKKNCIEGKIEVKNISFRYSEHEPFIFNNINFVIEAGETVALTGPSGCGKTTLLKCLMGVIAPTGGEIFIDGKPLETLMNYRSQIASVMQDDQLLSGDIAENISCFAPELDLDKVKHFATLANVSSDIEKMPMQYNTLVGDMGSSLSGGQKQRIVLARALYREPRILFMDEATSHLDVNSEFVVNQNIQHLKMTRVIVAHRPETVASAGRQIQLAGHGDPQF